MMKYTGKEGKCVNCGRTTLVEGMNGPQCMGCGYRTPSKPVYTDEIIDITDDMIVKDEIVTFICDDCLDHYTINIGVFVEHGKYIAPCSSCGGILFATEL